MAFLPHLAERRGVFATFSERMEKFFFLHGHETNVLKQIENKQPVQTSFRCVLSRMQFHFTEAATYVSVLDVGNIRSEMHACERIFSSQGKLGSK